jgi:hypothetical protein
LWQGTRLLSGVEIAEAHPEEVTATEREFLHAGGDLADAATRDAERRAAVTQWQNRRLRWLLGGIVVALIIAVTVGVVALNAQHRAEAATNSAQARRLAAQSLTEQHPDLALLSAVEAVRSEAGPETYGALLTLLARAPQMLRQVHTQDRFLRTAGSPDGSVVYLAENVPVVRAINADTGTTLWQAQLSGQPGRLAPEPHGRGLLTVVLGFGSPACSSATAPPGRWTAPSVGQRLSPVARTCCRSGPAAWSASPMPPTPCSPIRPPARCNPFPFPVRCRRSPAPVHSRW